jgi:hypothetical protein
MLASLPSRIPLSTALAASMSASRATHSLPQPRSHIPASRCTGISLPQLRRTPSRVSAQAIKRRELGPNHQGTGQGRPRARTLRVPRNRDEVMHPRGGDAHGCFNFERVDDRTAWRAAIPAFGISVPQEELDELRRRVRATRWPDKESVSDRSQGIQLHPLVDYWSIGYEWRKVQATLKTVPQFITEIEARDRDATLEVGGAT